MSETLKKVISGGQRQAVSSTDTEHTDAALVPRGLERLGWLAGDDVLWLPVESVDEGAHPIAVALFTDDVQEASIAFLEQAGITELQEGCDLTGE